MFQQKSFATINNNINKNYNYVKKCKKSNILSNLQLNFSNILIIILIILINVFVITSTPLFSATKLQEKNFVRTILFIII